MQNRIHQDSATLSDPTALSHFIGEGGEEDRTLRAIDDVFREIKDHLTNEEKLVFSLYKNSKNRKKNRIYMAFLERHHGKKLTTSAITHIKKRMFCVLNHVGALLRFKQTRGLDYKLKQILTNRQFILLTLYEQRMCLEKIRTQIGIKHLHTLSDLFGRAVERLQQSKDADIQRYLVLLGNVLRFSRISSKSKR